MSKIEKELKHLGKAVSMTEAERVSMRENLNTYTQFHTANSKSDEVKSYTLSPLYTLLTNKFVPAFLIIALVIGSGATVAKASEEALPGDNLYPVKEFVEEVRAKALITNESKAQWAETRIARRIKEVQKLKLNKRLTPKNQELLNKKINAITARAAIRLIALEKRNPTRAKQIREKLKKHSLVLRKITAPTLTKKADIKASQSATMDTPSTSEPVFTTKVLKKEPTIIKKPIRKVVNTQHKKPVISAVTTGNPIKKIPKIIAKPQKIKTPPSTVNTAVSPASNIEISTSTDIPTTTNTRKNITNKIKKIIRNIRHREITNTQNRAQQTKPKRATRVTPTQTTPPVQQITDIPNAL